MIVSALFCCHGAEAGEQDGQGVCLLITKKGRKKERDVCEQCEYITGASIAKKERKKKKKSKKKKLNSIDLKKAQSEKSSSRRRGRHFKLKTTVPAFVTS